MDVNSFFSRLVRPFADKQASAISSTHKAITSVTNVRNFEALWSTVKGTLQDPDELQLLKGIEVTSVPKGLDVLLRTLILETDQHVVETASDSHTGQYMEYVLNHAVYATLVELSLSDKPFGITALVVDFTSKLLHTIPDHLLLHTTIIQPLCQLLRHASSDLDSTEFSSIDSRLGAASGVEERSLDTAGLMERARNKLTLEDRVSALWLQLWERIELGPHLLLVVFPLLVRRTPHATTQSNVPSDLGLIAINFLTRFLHDDQEKGNAARMAILSLLRIVFADDVSGDSDKPNQAEMSTRVSIARHLIAQPTNLVQVLVAGLGAIYSLLPSKVRLETASEMASRNQTEPMHLGVEVQEAANNDPTSDTTLRRLFDPEVQSQLNMLLDLIAFTDSVLLVSHYNGCSKELGIIATDLQTAIRTTLCTSFVSNVLCPALLESSADDGSATAIAAYLTCIAEDDQAGRATSVGSIIFHHLIGLSPPKGSDPVQYTLRDFIGDLFLHGSHDSVIAASTLLCALTRRYCSAMSGSLFAHTVHSSTRFAADIQKIVAQRPRNPLSSSLRFDTTDQSGAFQIVASEILPVALAATPRSSIYTAPGIKPYLAVLRQLVARHENEEEATDIVSRQEQGPYDGDAFVRMSCHSCLVDQLQQLDGPGKARQEHPQLVMNADDLLLSAMLGRLRNFFTSDSFTNLETCRAICDITLCPMTSLEGWLLPRKPEDKRGHTSSDQDEVDMLDNPFIERKKQSSNAGVIDILRQLLNDVDAFRESVPEFDQYLMERRQGLIGESAAHDGEARNGMARQQDPSAEPASLTPTKSRRPRMMSTLTSYLTPKKYTDTSSKLATSPADHTGSPAEVHYRQTTPVLLDTPVRRAREIPAAPYSMSKRSRRVIHRSLLSDAGSTASSDVYTMASSAAGNGVQPVTFSAVLDNVVVLEAFVREVIAVLVVRRSLGVDE